MNNTEINAILEEHDAYILAQSQKLLAGGSTNQGSSSIAVDDLAQQVRIKFWQALAKQPITYYRTYIRQIAYHEFVNLWRQLRPEVALPLSVEGELTCHNYNLMKKCASTQDPAEIVEQQEIALDLLNWAACQAAFLPNQQRRAITCELKDQIEDLNLSSQSCWSNQLASEQFYWPRRKEELHNVKASLGPVRKKFRQMWQARDSSREAS